jgi:hypothetical protein
MEFGDIAFGNADIFLRADATLDRIEAVRGGSASTFASNSPGGVINLISKTGEYAGGSVALNYGLGYDNLRTDFEYGAPVGEGWNFHIGGFWRQGEGVRRAGRRVEEVREPLRVARAHRRGVALAAVRVLEHRDPRERLVHVVGQPRRDGREHLARAELEPCRPAEDRDRNGRDARRREADAPGGAQVADAVDVCLRNKAEESGAHAASSRVMRLRERQLRP